MIHHNERDSQFTLWTKLCYTAGGHAVIFKTSIQSAEKEVLGWSHTSFIIFQPYLQLTKT